MVTDPRGPGARALQAAETRLAIMRALSERLVSKQLSDISADELGAAAGVSRVTFFNHFPTKEHAVDASFALLLYEEQREVRRRALTGVARIRHLFDWVGAWVDDGPSRARQTLAWFASRPLDRPAPELSHAERFLLSPDDADTPVLMPRDIFLSAIAEARSSRQWRAPGSDFELAHMLGALLTGGAFIGHSSPDANFKSLYRHHVEVALCFPIPTAPPPRRSPAKRR